jgi:hypothetical protein
MRYAGVATIVALCGTTALTFAEPGSAESRYVGMCDASAAVEVGKGYFVVGDDEKNKLNVYRIGAPNAVASLDLASYLGVVQPDGKSDETDIEGAARIGDRIYWITSHGANGEGKPQPSRRRLFFTDVVEDSAVPKLSAPKTSPYTALLDEIAATPELAIVFGDSSSQAPESPGGLGIEGLAATPEGELLIGFRNPRPQGHALVLPLRNPRAVLDSGAKPVFGKLRPLDLGGRGIRSLEWTGKDYVIVAGPFDDNGSFALYRWSGQGADVEKVPQKVLSGLNPEAIFKVAKGGRLYVLSDDGDRKVGDEKCKSKKVPEDLKGFRGTYLN